MLLTWLKSWHAAPNSYTLPFFCILPTNPPLGRVIPPSSTHGAPTTAPKQLFISYCACEEWDVCLNAKKSKNLFFGKKCRLLCELSLDGKSIEWVAEWKYLGITLKSGTNCSVKNHIKKFYRCANAILRIEGRSNDRVMLRLLETHCVPLLTYAIEVVHVTDQNDRRQLRVLQLAIPKNLQLSVVWKRNCFATLSWKTNMGGTNW